jgi:hypothetical protein
MGVALVIGTIIVAVLSLLFFMGHRALKLREETLKKIGTQSGEEIECLAYVAYHGGFQDIPKPQKLTAALADGNLVLLTNKGQVGMLPFGSLRKIDKFTTLAKHDPKRKSMVLWGPLNNLIFRDQERHFIVVEYQDKDNEDNRLLIECDNAERMKEMYEKLSVKWNEYRHRV